MLFAGFAIVVVANCYLGGEKSARNVILRNATVVGCVGNKQMKTLFERRRKNDNYQTITRNAKIKKMYNGNN